MKRIISLYLLLFALVLTFVLSLIFLGFGVRAYDLYLNWSGILLFFASNLFYLEIQDIMRNPFED